MKLRREPRRLGGRPRYGSVQTSGARLQSKANRPQLGHRTVLGPVASSALGQCTPPHKARAPGLRRAATSLRYIRPPYSTLSLHQPRLFSSLYLLASRQLEPERTPPQSPTPPRNHARPLRSAPPASAPLALSESSPVDRKTSQTNIVSPNRTWNPFYSSPTTAQRLTYGGIAARLNQETVYLPPPHLEGPRSRDPRGRASPAVRPHCHAIPLLRPCR